MLCWWCASDWVRSHREFSMEKIFQIIFKNCDSFFTSPNAFAQIASVISFKNFCENWLTRKLPPRCDQVLNEISLLMKQQKQSQAWKNFCNSTYDFLTPELQTIFHCFRNHLYSRRREEESKVLFCLLKHDWRKLFVWNFPNTGSFCVSALSCEITHTSTSTDDCITDFLVVDI